MQMIQLLVFQIFHPKTRPEIHIRKKIITLLLIFQVINYGIKKGRNGILLISTPFLPYILYTFCISFLFTRTHSNTNFSHHLFLLYKMSFTHAITIDATAGNAIKIESNNEIPTAICAGIPRSVRIGITRTVPPAPDAAYTAKRAYRLRKCFSDTL